MKNNTKEIKESILGSISESLRSITNDAKRCKCDIINLSVNRVKDTVVYSIRGRLIDIDCFKNIRSGL